MPLTSEIQDAILWPSFIFIFQSCRLSLTCMVNPVDQWTRSNSAQISDASSAIICANWSHLTASCSSARASCFFWSHAHTQYGVPATIGYHQIETSQHCLHL